MNICKLNIICQYIVVMNCRTPPAIHFGTHTWDLTTYNAYAKYTCDENYRLIGVDKIVCQSDGKWSDAPKCEIPPGKLHSLSASST